MSTAVRTGNGRMGRNVATTKVGSREKSLPRFAATVRTRLLRVPARAGGVPRPVPPPVARRRSARRGEAGPLSGADDAPRRVDGRPRRVRAPRPPPARRGRAPTARVGAHPRRPTRRVPPRGAGAPPPPGPPKTPPPPPPAPRPPTTDGGPLPVRVL